MIDSRKIDKKKYAQSEKGKAAQKRAYDKYFKTEKGKAAMKRCNDKKQAKINSMMKNILSKLLIAYIIPFPIGNTSEQIGGYDSSGDRYMITSQGIGVFYNRNRVHPFTYKQVRVPSKVTIVIPGDTIEQTIRNSL